MALDGLSLANIGIISEISPKDISQRAEEQSKSNAERVIKKIEELENDKVDPDKESKQEKQEQKKRQKKLPQKAYVVDVEGLDQEKNEKIIELTAKNNNYKVVYNSDKELVEIVNTSNQLVEETMSLEELKGFIMKVKNPLGVIVDRKI